MSFPAKYRGKCGCCGDWFGVGVEIAFTDDYGLVIADHLKDIKPKPVCQNCFMELPATGICDCTR